MNLRILFIQKVKKNSPPRLHRYSEFYAYHWQSSDKMHIGGRHETLSNDEVLVVNSF